MLAAEMTETDASLTEEQRMLESDTILTYDRYYAQVESSNAKIEQPKRQQIGIGSEVDDQGE